MSNKMRESTGLLLEADLKASFSQQINALYGTCKLTFNILSFVHWANERCYTVEKSLNFFF